MGSPPPPNAPPVAQQAATASAATFQVGAKLPALPDFSGGAIGISGTVPTTPFSLCGFKLPGPFPFKLAFTLPPFKVPLPSFLLALGISCEGIQNGHPLDFTAGLKWGGGRVGTRDQDPDDPSFDD